jgi:hypothetical protein
MRSVVDRNVVMRRVPVVVVVVVGRAVFGKKLSKLF